MINGLSPNTQTFVHYNFKRMNVIFTKVEIVEICVEYVYLLGYIWTCNYLAVDYVLELNSVTRPNL